MASWVPWLACALSLCVASVSIRGCSVERSEREAIQANLDASRLAYEHQAETLREAEVRATRAERRFRGTRTTAPDGTVTETGETVERVEESTTRVSDSVTAPVFAPAIPGSDARRSARWSLGGGIAATPSTLEPRLRWWASCGTRVLGPVWIEGLGLWGNGERPIVGIGARIVF
jgi:hypothetical protein